MFKPGKSSWDKNRFDLKGLKTLNFIHKGGSKSPPLPNRDRVKQLRKKNFNKEINLKFTFYGYFDGGLALISSE